MGKIVKKIIKSGDEPSLAQIKEVELASKKRIVFDEDSPELSFEDLEKMSKLAKERKSERRKETVTLRISPLALRKAKAVGKGYTGFLGRLIENALNDQDLVSRSL